jgi:hypothetical protein
VETQERLEQNKWYVYTFIAKRPVRSLKAKIRALTHRTSKQDFASILTRLGQIMHGLANYFKHAVAKWTFSKLDTFTWWRLVHLLRARHRWNWGQLRHHLTKGTGRWVIAADGVEYYSIEKRMTVSRYAYPERTSGLTLHRRRAGRPCVGALAAGRRTLDTSGVDDPGVPRVWPIGGEIRGGVSSCPFCRPIVANRRPATGMHR